MEYKKDNKPIIEIIMKAIVWLVLAYLGLVFANESELVRYAFFVVWITFITGVIQNKWQGHDEQASI